MGLLGACIATNVHRVVCTFQCARSTNGQPHGCARGAGKLRIYRCLLGLFLLAASGSAYAQSLDWQANVRYYCEKSDWASALHLLDQQDALAPGDVEVKSWRARVLVWSGSLSEAEHEYLGLLKISEKDPDYWAGLANVYVRQGRNKEALKALDTALQLDPRRADLHAARARTLRALGENREARLEFREALTSIPGARMREWV